MTSISTMIHEARVLFFHMGLAFRRMSQNKWLVIMEMMTMLGNNFVFFSIWILVFNIVPHLKGWELPDVAMMYGLGASCFGLAAVMFGGYRRITDDIDQGRMDSYLCKPASPYTLALTSESSASGWGDAITGPVFFLVFCHMTVWQMLLAMVMVIPGAIIVAAVGSMIYTIGFWVQHARAHADTILWIAVIFITKPLHGMPMWIKGILLTVFPIGYVSYLPVEMVRNPSVWLFIWILAGAMWSVILARFVFYRGLRQYKGVSSVQTSH